MDAIRHLTLLLLAAAALAGCGRDKVQGQPFPVGTPSFAVVNEAIFKPRCLVCHSGTHPPNLTSYAEIRASLAKIKQVVLVAKTMPKGKQLPDDERMLLEQWIAAGAPEMPDTTPPAGPDRPIVTWKELQAKVVKMKCAMCHFDKNPGGLSNLEDYDTFKQNAGPIYFLVAVNMAMPPPPKGTPEGAPNPNALSRAEKDVLAHWIDDGMPK